ncbi:hypothetical protein PGT21_011630 [Puccinia graminis f. sp. tritici]|uniref:Secreted protein n=1 Tax=Puccinia graminis f. sp. tritici TaxID=56615 RepID=A0A5B0PU82_PUCGR|nr:hypothetical protein PGT21_011630 [Puccinia graminis f. sp. tritici]
MFGFSAVSLVALLVSLLQVRTGSALPTPQFVPVGMPIVINPAPIVPARQVVPMIQVIERNTHRLGDFHQNVNLNPARCAPFPAHYMARTISRFVMRTTPLREKIGLPNDAARTTHLPTPRNTSL